MYNISYSNIRVYIMNNNNNNYDHILQQCMKINPIIKMIQHHLEILKNNNYLLSQELKNIIQLLDQLQPWHNGIEKELYATRYRDTLTDAINNLHSLLLTISHIQLNDTSIKASTAFSELNQKIMEILKE